MHIGTLEHVNITVRNPKATAARLCSIFGWHIRWEGPSKMGGHTVHVGSQNGYLAVYSSDHPDKEQSPTNAPQTLNHIGIVVDNLDIVATRVREVGLKPQPKKCYDPGCRFYFLDDDGVEYEVISYAKPKSTFRKDVSALMGEMARWGALMR